MKDYLSTDYIITGVLLYNNSITNYDFLQHSYILFMTAHYRVVVGIILLSPFNLVFFADYKFHWEIHHKHFPWHHSMPPEKAVKLLSGFWLWHNQRTPYKNQTQTKRSPNAPSSGRGSSSVGNGVGVHSKLMTDKAFCIIFNFIFTMRSSCSTPFSPSPPTAPLGGTPFGATAASTRLPCIKYY